MLRIRKKEIPFCAVLLVFAIICAATNIISGDDVVNYYSYVKNDRFHNPIESISGRYFSEAVGYLFFPSTFLRLITYVVLFYSLLRLMSGCAQTERRRVVQSWMSLCLICTMRAKMFAEVFMWIGSYLQYVTAMVLILIYIQICLREFSGKPLQTRLAIPLFALIGAAASLCAEHMTIYNCILALFIVLYTAISKRQRLRLYQIVYAVASFGAAVAMFLHPGYQAVVDETDTITYRFIEFTPIDILTQIYLKVVGPFSLKNLFLNALLTAAVLILYIKTDRNTWRSDHARFAKAALGITIAYPLYYMLNILNVRLLPLDGSMRLYALETAFAFLHVVSLIFLAIKLTSPRSAFRFTLFLLSAVMCAAPFCMANPVNERCFFATYCFWVMTASEIIGQAADKLAVDTQMICKKTAALLCIIPVCYISYINIVNWLIFKENVKYIKQQLADQSIRIKVIDEQYPEYASADSFNTVIEYCLDPAAHKGQWLFYECQAELYGIDTDALKNVVSILHISIYDYLL